MLTKRGTITAKSGRIIVALNIAKRLAAPPKKSPLMYHGANPDHLEDHTQITTIENVTARVLTTTLSSQSRKSPHSLDPRLLKERYIEKFAILGDLRIPTSTSEGALGRGRLVAPSHGSIGRRSGAGWARHTQVATCAPSRAQGRLLKAAIRVASHRRIRKCQPSRPMPVLPYSIRSSVP